jgi:hypothetical protein
MEGRLPLSWRSAVRSRSSLHSRGWIVASFFKRLSATRERLVHDRWRITALWRSAFFPHGASLPIASASFRVDKESRLIGQASRPRQNQSPPSLRASRREEDESWPGRDDAFHGDNGSSPVESGAFLQVHAYLSRKAHGFSLGTSSLAGRRYASRWRAWRPRFFRAPRHEGAASLCAGHAATARGHGSLRRGGAALTSGMGGEGFVSPGRRGHPTTTRRPAPFGPGRCELSP